MKPKHYLVVGASSVAGQKAIEAIQLKDPDARITLTTSKSATAGDSTPLIDRGLINGVDLTKPETIRNIKPALTAPVDVLVFCPAFGMVGYPSELAPIADVEASGLWPGTVVTEVTPAAAFWEAEPEHQDYLARIPNGYTCHFPRPGWRLPKRAGV